VVAVSPFIGDEVFSGPAADLMAGVGRDPRPRASPTRTRSRTRSSSTTTIRPTSQTVTSSAPIPGSTTRTTPSASLGCATARWRRWKERRRKRTRRWRSDGERRRVPAPVPRRGQPQRRGRRRLGASGGPHADAAILGGIAVDPASRAAARDLVARDRSEFLPADPLAWIDRELDQLSEAPIRPGVNVRSATVEPVREAAAAVCAERDAVCEVNAHCRQSELRAVGCGESLLRDIDRLAEYVAAVAETGATTSVKVRAEVPGVDLVAVTDAVADAGADWLHVDAMDSEDRRRTDRRSGDRRDRFSPRRSHRDR